MITIVGASAAGLSAAYLLAKAGFKVRLFEKNKVIGPPPRTLIVTGKILGILDFDLGDVVVNKIKKVEFFSPHSHNSLKFKNPDLIIEREKLLKLLAEKAVAAGVKIQTRTKLDDIGSGVYTPELLDRDAETTILIDASGVKKSSETAALLQAEVETPKPIDKHAIQVFFDREKTKYFFWIIPKSETEAAVGLISDDAAQARNVLDEFLAEKNFAVKSFQEGQVPLFKPFTPFKPFAVGDAADQVKVDTVGGVVAGLRGAQALATSIIKGTSYPSQRLIGLWPNKEARRLNWELTLHWLARRTLNNLTNDDYDRLLKLLTPKVKKILATYNRDEAARGALKLFLAQPKLLTFTPKIF